MPIIAVFTKYDQFKRNVKMKLEDEGYPELDVEQKAPTETKKRFERDYLGALKTEPVFVRLARRSYPSTSFDQVTDALVVEMHKPGTRCQDLIEATAHALSSDVLAVMLLAVQRGNLELSVKVAVER